MRLEITIDYSDEKTAEAVLSSVVPDNEGFVVSERTGRKILFVIESDSAGTVRSTADDLLACVKTAEDSLRTRP